MQAASSRSAGFSLMEVTITLGVVAFALIALLGMLPLAVDASRDCIHVTRSAQLARMVFSTLAGESFVAAPCFAEGDDPLNLAELDSSSSPVLLYASYDIGENIRVVRAELPPVSAAYRIELQFSPESILMAGRAEVRGSTIRLRVTDVATGKIVFFEGSEFLNRLERVGVSL